MSRLSTFRADLFNAVTHLFGYDVFIEADDSSSRGPLKFERVPYGDSGTEFFGLGLHVVVSSVDYNPSAATRRAAQ